MKCPINHTQKIEIPEFLSHLSVYRGFPVFYTAYVKDGRPDFRVTDEARREKCIKDALCGVCGKRLYKTCWFIGGSISLGSHYFTDPAMHEACAEYSAITCPFLNGKKTEYADLETVQRASGAGVVAMTDQHVRPEHQYLMEAPTKKMRGVTLNNHFLVYAGADWLNVKEF